MSSGLRAELREALKVRLEAIVQSYDLASLQVSFSGGSTIYTTPQLYRFFDVSAEEHGAEEVKAVFDRDFVDSIRLLESSEPGDLRLFELYPLMRRIILLMEGYLEYVGRSTRLEGTLAHGYSLPEITVYDILDSLYEEACKCSLDKEHLLKNLTTMFEEMTNGLDSVLLSISGFVNVLVPIIANSFENEVDNILESMLATFTFGALQRISALFLLLVTADQTYTGSSQSSQDQNSTLLALSGEEAMNDNMYRVDFLCKETLCKALTTKITDHYLSLAWQEDIVCPILGMLQYSFVTSARLFSRKENLSDVVLATTVGFLSKTTDDCTPSNNVLTLMLGFGRQLMAMFVQGLEAVNIALWSHYELQLNHVLKLQQNRTSPTSETTSPPTNVTDDSHGNGGGQSPTGSGAPPSRSLSTLLSATEVQNRFTELLSFLEYQEKRHVDLFDVLFEIPSIDDDLDTVDCLSKLFAHFANLVQLGDALLYITQRSPNATITELLSNAINSTWLILRAFGDRVPFGVLKACFYDLGSEFHMDNIAAQICCFNVITHDLSKMRLAYENNIEMYMSCVDMLRALFRGSSSACCPCVSYRQNKTKRFSSTYLTISSAFIGRWFVMECLVGDASERRGLLDAFVEWCHSSNIEEYLVARFLCRLLTRVCKEDQTFQTSGTYVLDVLLGLCLHSNHAERTLRNVLTPLDPGRLNAFTCLSVYLNNGIFTEWILENVVLPYTCVFVREVVEFLDAFLGTTGQPSQHAFECYFVKNAGTCKCMESPLINGSPSVVHFLEFLSTLSWECYAPTNEDRSSLMLKHVLVVLCGILGKLVQFLHANKERGDIESRFSIFVLAAKVASVLVSSGHFGRKNNQVVLILKLYSLLGNQNVCMPEQAEMYLSLILQALCVFHAIFDHVPVKDQLMKLHNGFLALLLSKISSYPGLLLRHDLYKGVPTALVGQLSGYFANMLRQSRSLSRYLNSLYNFKVWTVCRDYSVDREDIKVEYVETALKSPDEPPEMRIMLNTAFLVFCRLSALSGGRDTRTLVEAGSCVGIYSK